MASNPSVQFVVGNTYSKIPPSQAPWDRSRRFRKVHEWTLYVDVVAGDADLIERVSFDLGTTFDPPVFHSTAPVPVACTTMASRSNGNNNGNGKAWRFCTKQQTYGPGTTATIKIRGSGGSSREIRYEIALSNYRQKHLFTFHETNAIRPFKMLKLVEMQRFGIELELTAPMRISLEAIANYLQGMAKVMEYQEGRVVSNDIWKIVSDSSILCSRSMPDCNTFELVSPVLQGGKGLREISRALRNLETIQPQLKVNKSMGFHVHIDVSKLSHSQLVKVCQNFVKYEAVMDTFMPPSRRTGSVESDQYFKSHCQSVCGTTNRQRHDALANCQDLAQLVHMMNRGQDRYYKLNMQNLATGRQPTIEFRQHSATVSYAKVSAWVRFCVAFVNNSARLKPPTPFRENRDLEYQFDALFQYVIKDRGLRTFYQRRRKALLDETNPSQLDNDDDVCCQGCAMGGVCSASKRRRR